jgi:DNA-binding response OmpR family regulator
MRAIVIAMDREEGDFISYVLRHVGLSVAVTLDVERIMPVLVERPADLIVVIGDAAADTSPIVSRIRQRSQSPLLALIESFRESDQSDLLDAGADLVLSRPVSPRLLSRYARIFLRRGGNVPAAALDRMESHGVVLEPASRMVTIDGESCNLTQLEFRLLFLLMSRSGQVVDLDEIVARVWGYSGEGARDLVRGLVRRLRRKLEPSQEQSTYIHNVIGLGYRFARDE